MHTLHGRVGFLDAWESTYRPKNTVPEKHALELALSLVWPSVPPSNLPKSGLCWSLLASFRHPPGRSYSAQIGQFWWFCIRVKCQVLWYLHVKLALQNQNMNSKKNYSNNVTFFSLDRMHFPRIPSWVKRKTTEERKWLYIFVTSMALFPAFWAGTLHFHFALSTTNYVASPASTILRNFEVQFCWQNLYLLSVLTNIPFHVEAKRGKKMKNESKQWERKKTSSYHQHHPAAATAGKWTVTPGQVNLPLGGSVSSRVKWARVYGLSHRLFKGFSEVVLNWTLCLV